MGKKSEEKIIKETKYCKIKSQGKVGEGDSKILDTENSFNEKTSCLDNSLHS